MTGPLDVESETRSTDPRALRGLSSNSALLFGARLVGNVGFLAAVLLLARGLSVEGRGTIAFIMVVALVGGRGTALGLTEATMVFAARRVVLRPVLLSNVLLSALVTSIAGAAIACGLLLAAGDARPSGVASAELVALALGTVTFALVEAGYAFLIGCSRFGAHAVVTASAPWVYALLLAAVWAADGLTVLRAAVVWTIAGGIWSAMLIVVAARGIGFGRPSVSLFLDSVRFGARAWLGTFFTFLNFRTDQILIGFIATEATLGVYAVAVNGAEVLLYLPEATATAMLPLVARTESGRDLEQTLRAFRLLVVITLGTIAVAAAVGPFVLPLVFGAAYDASVAPFLLLLPGAFGYVAIRVFSTALVAAGSSALSSLGPSVSLVVGIILDLVLIPAFGASGAAAAASIAFATGGTAALVAYRGRVPFAWGHLMPRRDDLGALRALARRPRSAS